MAYTSSCNQATQGSKEEIELTKPSQRRLGYILYIMPHVYLTLVNLPPRRIMLKKKKISIDSA